MLMLMETIERRWSDVSWDVGECGWNYCRWRNL